MAATCFVVFAAGSSRAEQGSTSIAPATPVVIDGLGKGTAPLHGPWQFHLGDNPAWAAPSFDSQHWEQLTADRPWGEQGHARFTGIAWYRISLALRPAPGLLPQFSLLAPRIDDAYEIYWNGRLIGRNGTFQPYPVWYSSQPARIFDLGQEQRGVLAVRVWKAPLLSDDSGEAGGFAAAPLVGSPEAIAVASAALNYEWLSNRQFLFGENLLYAMAALLSFLLWARDPARWPLFWMTGFAAVSPINLLLLDAHIGLPYVLTMGVSQSISAIRDVSLWFLLLWILPLHGNRALVRLARILAAVLIVNGIVDGVLIAISWKPEWIELVKTADAVSAVVYTVLGAFPLVLVGYAILQRKRLGTVSRMVAGVAFVVEMIAVVRSAVKQGSQFTGWSLADSIDSPLFTFGGSAITVYTLAGALMLVAIIYAVYNSVREDQRRQITLEREKMELMRAREQMRYNAEHDGLTGLWNHRIIVQRLRWEMDRSQRDGTPLSVILVDIDHFKRVNDSFGHLAGDLVLKEISAIFAGSLRSYDWVGRYGGEEFLLILPGSEIESALSRAEELRQAVQSAQIMDGETKLQVTASFGVASGFPPDYAAEAVIRAVDAALYRAKGTGRNCVVTADIDKQLCEQ